MIRDPDYFFHVKLIFLSISVYVMNGSTEMQNRVSVVLGSQWGDEGKGKLVDLLSADVDIVARCQGGNNAGHTVVDSNGSKYAFHLLPSGLAHPNVQGVLGNGVVIHVNQLFNEIEENKVLKIGPSRLKISDRAHIVFDSHQKVDGLQEGLRSNSKIMLGTTKKGIGPTYASKATRSGIRISDLTNENFDTHFASKFLRLMKEHESQFPSIKRTDEEIKEELEDYRKLGSKIRPFVTETISFLQIRIKEGSKILVEGANASMLDIDFGTYPYVTSSNCSIGGVCTGLGIPPASIGDVFGVIKSYTTRVGAGAFPTMQDNEIGEYLQRVGHETGVTTGRKRMCGWLDIPLLRFTHSINNYTACALTKLDILDQLQEIKIGVEYRKRDNITGELVSLEYFPTSAEDFEGIDVQYITLPGWKRSTSGCKKFENLPTQAQDYVKKVETLLGVYIRWIGVGPGRDDIIERQISKN